jgi:hypothetical protein
MIESKNIAAAAVIAGLVIAAFLFKDQMVSKPRSLVLQIPFSSQAPNGNWDNNEDCEETSIIMANAFLSGNTENVLSAALVAEAIENLKKWEQENLGYNKDTGADATALMAEQVYGLKIRQIVNFSEQDLKHELNRRRPILMPVNAKLLDTPKYRDMPAFYHMIVVRGYNQNEKGFIVNDPGTEDGNGNAYSFETLKNAATDWNHDLMRMEPDKKIALVVSK